MHLESEILQLWALEMKNADHKHIQRVGLTTEPQVLWNYLFLSIYLFSMRLELDITFIGNIILCQRFQYLQQYLKWIIAHHLGWIGFPNFPFASNLAS